MTREEAKKEIEAALLGLSQPSIEGAPPGLFDASLGYLAITSKPEAALRDRVAWYFHSKRHDVIAAREYHIERKRVDLALLNATSPGLEPVVLIEFKVVMLGDPLSNPKLGLVKSLIRDLKDLASVSGASRFGVMVKVEIEDPGVLKQQGLDHGVAWTGPTRGQGPPCSEKLSENARAFFDRAKLRVSPLPPISLGAVWGTSVNLCAFILEPQ